VPLAARLADLPPGTPYVLALLKAYSDVPLDAAELAEAVHQLTGGTATLPTSAVYTIMAGLVGQRPSLVRRESEPFRTGASLAGLPLDIRMESWLPADTMRRAGFGHVIVAHRHVFTLERGVSVVAFGRDGRPVATAYASGLFVPPARLRIRLRPTA
jgi:hypothetical protein